MGSAEGQPSEEHERPQICVRDAKALAYGRSRARSPPGGDRISDRRRRQRGYTKQRVLAYAGEPRVWEQVWSGRHGRTRHPRPCPELIPHGARHRALQETPPDAVSLSRTSRARARGQKEKAEIPTPCTSTTWHPTVHPKTAGRREWACLGPLWGAPGVRSWPPSGTEQRKFCAPLAGGGQMSERGSRLPLARSVWAWPPFPRSFLANFWRDAWASWRCGPNLPVSAGSPLRGCRPALSCRVCAGVRRQDPFVLRLLATFQEGPSRTGRTRAHGRRWPCARGTQLRAAHWRARWAAHLSLVVPPFSVGRTSCGTWKSPASGLWPSALPLPQPSPTRAHSDLSRLACA